MQCNAIHSTSDWFIGLFTSVVIDQSIKKKNNYKYNLIDLSSYLLFLSIFLFSTFLVFLGNVCTRNKRNNHLFY